MRLSVALLVSIAVLRQEIVLADDNPEVAAAVARIEALGGDVERENDEPTGPVIRVVLVGNPQLKAEDLAFLKPLTGLQELYLGNTATTDAGLKNAAGLKELRVLGLVGTSVTDAGMKELAGLQKLERLLLANTAITDEGLKEIAKLKGLKVVRLGGTKTTDAGIKQLEESLPGLQTAAGRPARERKSAVRPGDKPEVAAAITQIEALDGEVERADDSPDAPVVSVELIGSEKLKDEDLSCLKSLAGVQQLYLGHTATSDVGLKHIAGLTRLTFLGLIGTKVTDAGMKELAALQKLETLFLANTAVTEEGLKELSKLENLQELLLPEVALTDAGLEELGKLRNLRQLDLGQAKITDEGLKHLGGLTKLEDLSLNDTGITDDGLKQLGKLERLTRLDVSHTRITDEGLKSLEAIPRLKQLDLSHTGITDTGLKDLAKLKMIKSIYLAGTTTTDAGLKELKESLPNVRPSREALRTGGGGQRSDPDFDVSVAHPAFTERHPSVLFDEAHHNFHTSGGRYKAFADLIINDGCRVVPNLVPFTRETLAGYDVLVIANALAGEWSGAREAAGPAFTEAECDSVQKWIEAGGSLLLITDHEPFGSAAEELGKRFGVEMGKMTTVDPANDTKEGLLFAREKNQLADHPILNGRDGSERVDRVLTFTGQSLKGPQESVALLKFADTARDRGAGESASAAGRAQGVALKHGRGRVVVMGEAAQLSAQVVGNPPQPMGMNVPDCDNRKMALNVMHWLIGLTD